jgi:GTP-binding protein HflX
MSRLTGGIGGRGPGETRLEINRRRARDRIRRLEKAVATVQKNRSQQRSRRSKKVCPSSRLSGTPTPGNQRCSTN